jgi:hypothetical protein
MHKLGVFEASIAIMSYEPESTINLSSDAVHVIFCLDTESQAVLTVVRSGERIQSWWSGRDSLGKMIDRYRENGLTETVVVPAELRVVILRRWVEVDALRCEYISTDE